MKRRSILKMAPGLAVLGAPSVWAQAPGEILLGLHGPMTGPASWVGLGARDGTLLAIEEINAEGGINGRKIRLISYDDGGKPSESEAVTKKMIEGDKVFAIMGGGVSSTAIPAAETAHKAKVPYMNAPAASPKILDIKSRWVFTGATIDVRDISENESAFVGDFLKAKRVAGINSVDEFSQSLSDTVFKQLKERYNIDPVARQKFNPGDTDFSSQLLEIRKANPDLILLNALYVEAGRIVKQARELGIRVAFKGDTSTMNKGFLTIAGPAAEGCYHGFANPYFNGDPSRDMQEFEARYKKMYPRYPADRPNYVDTYNYGTMYALAEGLKRMGPNLDRRKLAEALETLVNFKATDFSAKAVNVIQTLSFNQTRAGNRRMTQFNVTGGQFRPVTEFKGVNSQAPIPPLSALTW
jgi:branched-chain amino acid transport system substrate-binding protein